MIRLKIKRGIAASIMLFIIIISSIPGLALDNENKVYNFDVVVQDAIESNAKIKLYDEKIKLADRRYNNSLSDAEKAVNKYWESAAQRIENKKVETLYPLQKLEVLNDLKWEKENYIATLKNDLKKLYIKVQVKESQLDLQITTIKNLLYEYDVKKILVEQGTATELSLLSFEISIQEAQDNLASLEWEKEKLINEIKIKAGYDLNEALKIEYEEIQYELMVVEDITKLIEEEIQASHSIKELDEDLELTKKEHWIVTAFAIVEVPKEVDTLKEKIEDLEYNIENEKITLELKIRSDYNNLLNFNDDITIRKLSLDKTIKQEEITKVKHELGLVSSLDYIKSQNEVSNAQAAYNKAIIDYHIAVLDFQHFMDRQ